MNRNILLSLFVLVAVVGSFLLTLFVLSDGKSVVPRVATSLATLLESPSGYEFKTSKSHASASGKQYWFSVVDSSPEKTAFVGWISRAFGDSGVHTFNLVVKKTKKSNWSQLQIVYTADKVRQVYVYRFRTDTGKILPRGKTRPEMLWIEDQGKSWRIVGNAHIPPNASLMQILLYPALGAKGTIGALNIREFSLSEPS